MERLGFRAFRTKAYRLAAGLLLLAVSSVLAGTASAHIVREAPWTPIAAAYRTIVFFADLKPIPWTKIRAAWTAPHEAAASKVPALAKLRELDPPAAVALSAALATEDRGALFAAATRATSAALRAALRGAEAALDNGAAQDGGDAQAGVTHARAIYRAFEPFIRQADPNGHRTLGRAWLELTSSAGNRGVLGAGGLKPDRTAFAAARMVIDAYLRTNYEPTRFRPRKSLHPVPETALAKGPVKIAPWLPPGTFLGDQTPLPRLVLNFEEAGIDEKDLPLVAYGDMLFDSPMIFGEPARSLGLACATCHNRSDINRDLKIPGATFHAGSVDVDGGFFNPIFNDRRDDPVDIPSLRGIRFTGPYGRDGRMGSLRDFTRNVIVGEFAGAEPTPFMIDALIAYMNEFDFLPNSKLTADGHLTAKASEAAQAGEKIFKRPFAQMDGKSCATCHVPSANFLDRKAHDIGSLKPAYEGARGGAFDTPTLLGTRFTAPYFHGGSLPTLAAVVKWFDGRYGLNLPPKDLADLTAYVETVGDADAPYQVFKGRDTPFRLAFDELTTFATTLDTLIPARDGKHALLLIDTVVPDLIADAGTMGNFSARSDVRALADALAAVGKEIRAGRWDGAAAKWATYQGLVKKIDKRMY